MEFVYHFPFDLLYCVVVQLSVRESLQNRKSPDQKDDEFLKELKPEFDIPFKKNVTRKKKKIEVAKQNEYVHGLSLDFISFFFSSRISLSSKFIVRLLLLPILTFFHFACILFILPYGYETF